MKPKETKNKSVLKKTQKVQPKSPLKPAQKAKSSKILKKEKGAKKTKALKKENRTHEVSQTKITIEKNVVLTDAEGRILCQLRDCDQPAEGFKLLSVSLSPGLEKDTGPQKNSFRGKAGEICGGTGLEIPQ